MVTFEELLRACLYEQEALQRVLVRKGLLVEVSWWRRSRGCGTRSERYLRALQSRPTWPLHF